MNLQQDQKHREILAQYDKFVLQLREEVSQLFFLHNFFFAINSALLGSTFLKKFSLHLLPLVTVIGLVLTFYWFSIMSEKNRWREEWLERIKKIEAQLSISEDFRMWPESKHKNWKGGLSNKLFFWPVGFFGVAWLILLIFPFCLS